MANQIDLKKMFKAVTDSLVENKDSLNQSDSYNHNHGDNMVEIFTAITKAMDAKKGADVSDQLSHASELVKKTSQSGSANLYGENLMQAAQQLKGQQITGDNALQLVQLLLGSTQAQAGTGAASGDILGDLLSGLTGAGSQALGGQDGLDAGDLLAAGMTFLQSKQAGSSNIEALIQAVVSTSQMSQSPHRAQSGALVAKSLFDVINSMSAK